MYRIVIPARYASTRLPGKPLADLAGQPMIRRVWQNAAAAGAAEVVIATDDARVAEACTAFGAMVEMTSAAHATGTDRLAEVVERRGWDAADIVVNVQGDEPLLPPSLVRQAAALLESDPQAGIATLATPIGSLEELLDPAVVKVVWGGDGHALYFSRAPIPWQRDGQSAQPGGYAAAWRHVGLYAYRSGALRRLAAATPSPLEQIEKLEQLRALENSIPIAVAAAAEAPGQGVDTPADLERVRRLLARQA